MLNNKLKITPKVSKDHVIVMDDQKKSYDLDDAKYELYAAVAEYVNAVAPGKKFDVTKTGEAVVDFICDYLCLNPYSASIWDPVWGEEGWFREINDAFDALLKDVPNDNKWHNTEHVDKPGLKIDKWVKKHIG